MSRAAPRPPWLRAAPPDSAEGRPQGQAGAENCRTKKGAIPSPAVQISFPPPFFIVVKHKIEHLNHFRGCSAVALGAFTVRWYPPPTPRTSFSPD